MSDANDIIDEEEVMEEKEIEDLTSETVVSRYGQAAEIANKALTALASQIVAGKTTTFLCSIGDAVVKQLSEAAFRKQKDMKKGSAFPVCVSVNECVCHATPLDAEEPVVLKAGDVVKVDLGVQLDGYPVVVAQTFIVPGEKKEDVKGPAADVYMAALHAAYGAFKTIQVGASNADVTKILGKVAEGYGVNLVQGVLMHEIARGVIDKGTAVLAREEGEQRVEDFTFEAGHVYTVDVVMSTGAGKPIQREARTNVFKRNSAKKYELKSKSARNVMNDVKKNFSSFPFSIRQLADEREARLGLKECIEHGLLIQYPVLFEKPGDLVAHFKFTVLLMPSGNGNRITGPTLEAASAGIVSEKKLDAELLEFITTPPKKIKKAKAEKAAAA